MRLLWLKSDYIIPPDSGGKIRTYNLLKGLNRLCDVTYASLKSSPMPNDEPEMRECAHQIFTVHRPEEEKSGAAFYARVLAKTLSRSPYIAQKYRCPELVAFQRKFLGQSQDAIVLCDFLEMCDNVDWTIPAPKVLFQHNVETMIWRRYYANETSPLKRAYFNYEQKRMGEYERESCNRFDIVLTVSEEDKTTLARDFGVTRPIYVVETGIDADFFAPRRDISPISGKLVFTGSMDWMPNIDGIKWFVAEVYPHIKVANPGVTLDIVGRRPGPDIRALALADCSITVTGDVPDIRPYLAHAELVIVPLRIGGGSRLKIYEAMAMGRPTLATTIGAEGLPLTPQEHIMIADGPLEFARAVNSALVSPDIRESMAARGARFVTENYQWTSIAQKLHHLLAGLISNGGRREQGRLV